jgi:hypothetical protein
MMKDGFKRLAVLGMVASALMLSAGCRNERGAEQQGVQGQKQPTQDTDEGTGGAGQQEMGEDEAREPEDLRQEPEEEGFQSVPENQEAPSGIGLDGRGGSEGNQHQGDQH